MDFSESYELIMRFGTIAAATTTILAIKVTTLNRSITAASLQH